MSVPTAPAAQPLPHGLQSLTQGLPVFAVQLLISSFSSWTSVPFSPSLQPASISLLSHPHLLIKALSSALHSVLPQVLGHKKKVQIQSWES